MPRVVRPLVYLEHPLHAGHERVALLLRNAPHFPSPWFQFVFFNACRTVSSQIDRPLQAAPALPPASSRSTERGLPVEPNRPPEPDALPSPHPASSAPEAAAEAYAPEPSSDPAPPPADARAGRSAPSPQRIHHLPRPSVPGQRPPDPQPAESVHAVASSPTPHAACSTSAPLPTHPAHPGANSTMYCFGIESS